jgi:hypothetical protein
MLKAGSLIHAIAIAILIALISSVLILFSGFTRIGYIQFEQQQQVIRNAYSGINLLMADANLSQEDETTIDLYDRGSDSVKLSHKAWGAFEVLIAEAFTRSRTSSQMAMVGSVFKKDDQLALFIADQDKVLSLCGNTTLKGLCYLPKGEVKQAYIEGKSFTGEKMVNGEIRMSPREVPAVNKEIVNRLRLMIKQVFSKTDSVIYLNKDGLTDTLVNSFRNKTIFLSSIIPLVLDNICISGNVALISSAPVKIRSSSQIKNALIIAPRIEIEDDFAGSLQAFATDTFIVGKKCHFSYPSVLGVFKDEKSKNSPYLLINEGTELNGIALAVQESIDIQRMVKISIAKDAKIQGQVYSNGILQMNGVIYGMAICRQIQLTTPSSVYENHLLDAVIDRSKLSPLFSGVSLESSDSTSKQVIKWLN